MEDLRRYLKTDNRGLLMRLAFPVTLIILVIAGNV